MNMSMNEGKIVAELGINWLTVYKVLRESEELIELETIGHFHAFDESRKYRGKIDDYMTKYLTGRIGEEQTLFASIGSAESLKTKYKRCEILDTESQA